MKIASKALVTIMLTAMLALSATGISSVSAAEPTAKTNDKKLSRLYRKHDRKMELRAATLGMSTDELKSELDHKTWTQILKSHGFKSEEAFQVAMVGKTKDELKRRGWSDEKISEFIDKRLQRLQ